MTSQPSSPWASPIGTSPLARKRRSLLSLTAATTIPAHRPRPSQLRHACDPQVASSPVLDRGQTSSSCASRRREIAHVPTSGVTDNLASGHDPRPHRAGAVVLPTTATLGACSTPIHDRHDREEFFEARTALLQLQLQLPEPISSVLHHCRSCERTLCHEHSLYYMLRNRMLNQIALLQYGIYTDVRVCYNCFNKYSSQGRSGNSVSAGSISGAAESFSGLSLGKMLLCRL